MVNTHNTNKRSHARKRRICRRAVRLISIVMIFAAALSAVLILSSKAVNTKAADTDTAVKYYKSIMVQPGDTLWSIADTYMDETEYIDERDFIKEVQSINHIDGEYIRCGSYIIVPYFVYE